MWNQGLLHIFTNNTGGTFNVTGFSNSNVRVTGGTHSNGTAIFTNNTGGMFNVTDSVIAMYVMVEPIQMWPYRYI
jgi:hypothetical protein